SLGVETLGGVMTKVIERNTTIPARRTETFSTAEDNQSAVDVVVLQGERERAADNRVLGRFRLEGIRPAPRGIPQIEVTFDIDANGILNVSARDKDTGAEQRITISESSNLDKAEVERMVREAQEHQAEDARLRQQIDARNALDSMAYRVEQRIAELGEQLPVHAKARAEGLVADARQALKGEAGPPQGAAQPAPDALAEIEGRLLRALADLENLRKRYARELTRETAAERARVAAQWLPVVDNLERALEHAEADPSALIEGVRAVWEQAVGVLRRLGFPRFDDVGERFDPSRHQAVSAVEKDDTPAGTVGGSAW